MRNDRFKEDLMKKYTYGTDEEFFNGAEADYFVEAVHLANEQAIEEDAPFFYVAENVPKSFSGMIKEHLKYPFIAGVAEQIEGDLCDDVYNIIGDGDPALDIHPDKEMIALDKVTKILNDLFSRSCRIYDVVNVTKYKTTLR